MDVMKKKVSRKMIVLTDTFSRLNQEYQTPGAGGHRNSGSTSLLALGATLVPTALTAGAFILAFILLRSKYRNIYAPRTYFRTIPRK